MSSFAHDSDNMYVLLFHACQDSGAGISRRCPAPHRGRRNESNWTLQFVAAFRRVVRTFGTLVRLSGGLGFTAVLPGAHGGSQAARNLPWMSFISVSKDIDFCIKPGQYHTGSEPQYQRSPKSILLEVLVRFDTTISAF